MRFQFGLAFKIFSVLCGALLLCLIFSNSLFVYWSDSEIWAATVARDLFSRYGTYAFSLKPLFYLPLWLSFNASELLGTWPMYFARGLFALNSFAMSWLCFSIMRRWQTQKQDWLPWVGIVLFLSANLTLERIFRVRSDLMAVTMILLSVYLCLRIPTGSPFRKKLLTLIPAVLSLFVTLNASFFLLFLAPQFVSLFHLNSSNIALKRKDLLLGACVLVVLVTGVLLLNFEKSYDFVTQSLEAKSYGIAYFDLKRFEHVFRWMNKDPFFFFCIFAKLVHDVICLRKKRPLNSIRSWFGAWALILILIHPNRLPFFLAAVSPFLVIWITDLPLAQYFEKLSERFKRIVYILMMMLAGVSSLSAFRHSQWLTQTHSNYRQLQAMLHLSHVIPKSDQLLIYDPVGILPYHSSYLWYLGPGQQQENRWILDLIGMFEPDILLISQRFDWFFVEGDSLSNRYTLIGRDAFLKKLNISLENQDPSEITSEVILDKLDKEFAGFVTENWILKLSAFSLAEELMDIEILTAEGKLIPLPTKITKKELSGFKRVIAPKTAKRLEISLVPPSDVFNSWNLYQLFRFDAEL